MLSLLDLEEPFRIISSLVERMGIDYNYVRRIVDEVKKQNLISIFPSYRMLGISLGIVITEKDDYPDSIKDGLVVRFFYGKTIAPKLYNIHMYAFDYTQKDLFLESIKEYDGSAKILLDEPFEAGISDYFREPDRLKVLSEFCNNPLISLRNIADVLNMPFSSVRYIVNRALAEKIIDASQKIMKTPRALGVQQLFVLSPPSERDVEEDNVGTGLEDVSLGELIHYARGEDLAEKMYYVRSPEGYNLFEYIGKNFIDPVVLILYNISIKELFHSTISLLTV